LHIIVVPIGNWDTVNPDFLSMGTEQAVYHWNRSHSLCELCGETEVLFLGLFDTYLEWTPTWVQHTCRCYLLDILSPHITIPCVTISQVDTNTEVIPLSENTWTDNAGYFMK
jgi:hypothetical protein